MITKKEIGRILWQVWDPIGVNAIPEARDEYDDYVEGVYSLLQSGVSDEQLAQHLLYIASDTMGLSGATLEDMKPTVEALRKVYPTRSN
jgi:hypothetical protein